MSYLYRKGICESCGEDSIMGYYTKECKKCFMKREKQNG